MHRFAVRFCLLLALCVGLTGLKDVIADGPADNSGDQIRRIPKPGVDVSERDQAELTESIRSLQEKIDSLRQQNSPLANELLPDVMIFHRAVDQALRFQEFFDPKEVTVGKSLLKQGHQRADQLLAGEAPWTKLAGTVVRGYISRIDKTVQPYGLVIPASYKFDATEKHRLDFWFHGRGELLSEVNFLNDRANHVGPISPADTIVLCHTALALRLGRKAALVA